VDGEGLEPQLGLDGVGEGRLVPVVLRRVDVDPGGLVQDQEPVVAVQNQGS
jgi:hypothetical protein